LDVHEPTATVREALIFSAVLRQPSTVSHEEKIAYVDHIINLLELGDIVDALIGGQSDLFLFYSQKLNIQ
jgi:ABC-type multidrug transport system ATPase subunit